MRTKWYNLAKLPKSKRWTSINDKTQTDGSLEPFFPGYRSSIDPNRIDNHGDMLDPTHPSARMRGSQFPKASMNKDILSIQIYPMARLVHGANPYPTVAIITWSERVRKAREAGFSAVSVRGRTLLCKGVDEKGSPLPYLGTDQVYPEDDVRTFGIPTRNATPKGRLLTLAMEKLARRIPMAFVNATSKKRMGSFAYMRARIAKRLRGAIQLIASRGAYAVKYTVPSTGAQRAKICLDEDRAGKRWSMQGWIYVFYPTTALYRMPLPDLITLVSDGLNSINDAARRMENTWLAESLLYYREPRSIPSKTETPAADDNPATECSVVPKSEKPEASLIVAKRTPVKRSASFSPTGGKNPNLWKKEMETGLALLSKRLSAKAS